MFLVLIVEIGNENVLLYCVFVVCVCSIIKNEESFGKIYVLFMFILYISMWIIFEMGWFMNYII